MRRFLAPSLFSSKDKAIENAKAAMSSISMCEDLFDQNGRMKPANETDCWTQVAYTSNSVGGEGGVIFKVEGDNGDERYVRITRQSFDQQPIGRGNMDRKVEGKPTKEVWLVEEIKYDYYEHKSELHVKSLLGLFSNKTAATKNFEPVSS